ncbi:MAG: PKD domain-containing protein [Bacteroidia bacterium]
MNTEQINKFDELMREKLNSYEETEPDMDLLVHIHARKNRFLRTRNLFTLIILLAIVSAGIVGGYYLSNGNSNQHQTPSTQTNELPSLTGTSARLPIDGSNNNAISLPNNFAGTDSVVDSKNNGIVNVYDYTAKSGNIKPTTNHVIGFLNNNALPKRLTVIDTIMAEGLISGQLAEIKSNKNNTIAENSDEALNTLNDKNNNTHKTEKDACTATISYYTTYDNGFNFMAKTNNPNMQLTWLFGDGKSSKEESPKHIYQKAGQYAVTLTAVDKTTKCKAETYTLVNVATGVDLTASSISGTVFADAEYATKTRVDLLAYNSSTNVYERVQSAFTNNKGLYEFNEIVEGNYLIKAADYKDYTSSYYGNTTDKEYANSVAIFANDYKELNGYDIQLVNHKVNNVVSKNNTDSGSKWMIVLDQNNNPIASVLVNSNGNIQSSGNLPQGNYNLMDPATGKTTGNLNVGAKGLKMGSPDVNTGAQEGLVPKAEQELVLLPNPAIDYVKVGLNPANNSPIDVRIVNSQGALVQSYTIDNGNGLTSINIGSLPVGTYYVVVKQNGVTTSSRLVKTLDSSK